MARTWRVMDSDQSGKLCFTEWCVACRSVGYSGDVRVIWAELDYDNSGVVSFSELDPEVRRVLGLAGGSSGRGLVSPSTGCGYRGVPSMFGEASQVFSRGMGGVRVVLRYFPGTGRRRVCCLACRPYCACPRSATP